MLSCYRVRQLYPEAKVLFISVADLRGIPGSWVEYVKVVLRRIDHQNVTEEIAEFARDFSNPPRFSGHEPIFVPDFSGELLEQLGKTKNPSCLVQYNWHSDFFM